jgi:hypothetical protein
VHNLSETLFVPPDPSTSSGSPQGKSRGENRQPRLPFDGPTNA